MHRLRRLVGATVALILGLTITVVIAGPVQACSCAPQTEAEAFAGAQAVFIGTLVGYETIDEFARVGKWRVSSVFKGNVVADQPVESPSNSAACGLDTEPGTTLLVFALGATEEGMEPGLATGLCSGSRPAAIGEVPPGFPAPRVLGGPPVATTRSGAPPSTRPVATTRSSASTTTTTPEPSSSAVPNTEPVPSPSPTAAQSPDIRPVSSTRPVWLFAIVALAALGGGGLYWRIRRRRNLESGLDGEMPL